MTKKPKQASLDQATPAPEQKRRAFTFRTEAQRLAWGVIQANTVTFLLGAAGTGKTQLATAYSQRAIARGEAHRIIHTRPVVEASEHLGWLPGDLSQKLGPYMRPLVECENACRQVSVLPEVIPLAYMRGLTLDDAVCILDEAQNCTYSQLKLYLTRLGTNSKLIICGDTAQFDIRDSGLGEVVRDLQGIPGVGSYTFLPEDSVRHPLVKEMLKVLR